MVVGRVHLHVKVGDDFCKDVEVVGHLCLMLRDHCIHGLERGSKAVSHWSGRGPGRDSQVVGGGNRGSR